ncbi:MAG: signal transduction histidine kinase [Hyphomicrobiaceae bacterium]
MRDKLVSTQNMRAQTTSIDCANIEIGSLSILLIEDDECDVRLVERCLARQADSGGNLYRAKTLAGAVAFLDQETVDVILLDLGLPDGVGPENVRRINAATDTAIVVLTGVDDEETAMAAVKWGAQDYLIKGKFTTRTLSDSLVFASARQRRLTAVTTASREESDIKDRFLSHASHELRTPLTAIMQFVSILQDGIAGELNEQQVQFLGIIQRNADQLKHMISTLMNSTRASSGKLTYNPMCVDFGKVVHAILDKLSAPANKAGVRLNISPMGWPDVVADPHSIEEVLTNLVENAIKFTPIGGSVSVSFHDDPSDPDSIVVTVKDTGCDLEPGAADNVFERLDQDEGQRDVCRQGLGLGLHIAREIIALHGGRIWAEDSRGTGSCFQFTLQRYSLQPWCRRVALVDGSLHNDITMLCIRAHAASNIARAKGVDSIVPTLRSLIASCLHGVCDEVLPHQRVGEYVVFAALARTGEVGAQAIVARLQDGIARQVDLQSAGFECDAMAQAFAIDVDAPDQEVALQSAVSRIAAVFASQVKDRF